MVESQVENWTTSVAEREGRGGDGGNEEAGARGWSFVFDHVYLMNGRLQFLFLFLFMLMPVQSVCVYMFVLLILRRKKSVSSK